jgi:hypothetical protein
MRVVATEEGVTVTGVGSLAAAGFGSATAPDSGSAAVS